jgi:hypothetical protein
MYDTTFDTGWEDLDKDDALERAFALGVTRSLDEPRREEYERILASADTAYRRSLIQLSYEEGRRKASNRPGENAADIWEALVADPSPAEPPPTDATSVGGPPERTSRPQPRALPEDGMERIQLPAFLRRR